MTWTVKMADARYDGYEEGFDEGREAGLQVGIEQGAYEKALETARAMLKIGIPLEQVQFCTNLPLDEVQSLL